MTKVPHGYEHEIKAQPTAHACGGSHVILLTSAKDAVTCRDPIRRAETAGCPAAEEQKATVG